MRTAREIYTSLKNAKDLEAGVKALSDDELRQVRGALARGEFKDWPAEMIAGLCILEGAERFYLKSWDVAYRALKKEQKRTTDGHGCTRMEEVPSAECEVKSGRSDAPLKNASGGTPLPRPAARRDSYCDCCHGAEVRQFRGAEFEKAEVIL